MEGRRQSSRPNHRESVIIPPMSAHGRLSSRVIELVAENRIREAIAEGKLDNLAGEGKPIPDIDEPYDPDWWVKKWIRRERVGQVLAEKFGRDWSWSR